MTSASMDEVAVLDCIEELRPGPYDFYETVLAVLAVQRRRYLPTGQDGIAGMRAAVDMLDGLIDALKEAGVPWRDVVPLVRIVAPVRPSPIGGLEGWRTQLGWFEGLWIVPDSADLAVMTMPAATGAHMLEKVSPTFLRLAERFADLVAHPVRD